MRNLLYGAAVLALASVSSPDAIRSALTGCASALFEATPFLLASIVIGRMLPRSPCIVELLGCGCGTGPWARSIPVIAATWILFGPTVAIARFAGALVAARVLPRAVFSCAERESSLLSELLAVVPGAAIAGVGSQIFALVDPARLTPLLSAGLGAVFGFVAPCGLGALSVAAALRVHAPLAGAAFLCIAGIVDLRALRPTGYARTGQDALSYALLAVALAIVACRHGGTLVRPAFATALACCAVAALLCALTYRHRRCGAARVAPAIMLFGALVGAPPPRYYATETTMRDIFPGERLKFTGALVRRAHENAIVRYAITCCRADATPVAVRLDRVLPYPSGTWLRVEGAIENRDGGLGLAPAHVERVAAPDDPFVYL